MTNAYSAFVAREMERRGITQTQLADATGMTKQNIGRIVNDSRPRLKQRPDPETVDALARGLNVPEGAIWLAVAEAMGIPISESVQFTREVDEATNEELLREIARRLDATSEKAGGSGGRGESPDQKSPSDNVRPLTKRERMQAETEPLPRASREDSEHSRKLAQERKCDETVGQENQDDGSWDPA